MVDRLSLYQKLLDKQDINGAIQEINDLRKKNPLDFEILIPWFESALSLNNINLVLSYIDLLRQHKLSKSAEIYLLNVERRANFQSSRFENALIILLKEINLAETVENNILDNTNKTQTWNQNNALKLMLDLLSGMAALNIPITMQGGTLLGIIRENNILKQDKDIDFCVDIKYLSLVDKYMKSIGLRRDISNDVFKNFATYFDVNSKITVDVMGLKYINQSIIGGYFEKNDNKEWSRELLYPNHLLKKQIIFNREIFMPSEPEKILTAEYGDWKTPNLNWITFLDAPNLVNKTQLNLYYILTNLLKYKNSNDLQKVERIKKELQNTLFNGKKLVI